MHARHEADMQWLEWTFPEDASMARITTTGGTTSSGWPRPLSLVLRLDWVLSPSLDQS